ncbi:hypothetical protein [Micrococcoides hystricis]|uniref:Toxin-antitoxin system YwqK family antitoxin n=1 Tax=Micrococcoides hystricis TaxID=1572761 RepID=A0ABV6P919_9MICC
MRKPPSASKLTPDPRWLEGAQNYVQRLDPGEVEELVAGHQQATQNDDASVSYLWLDDADRPHRTDAPAMLTLASGLVTKVQYFEHGNLHRSDGPAEIELQDGKPVAVAWLQHGTATNPAGPAQLQLFPDGSVAHILWTDDQGQKHRADAPAMQRFNVDGFVLEEEWWQHDQLHRLDGPAVTTRTDSGEVTSRWFYRNHTLHNELGPAHESFFPGGAPEQRVYYTEGLEDRNEGPYFEGFHVDGSLAEHRWAKEGRLERVEKYDEAGKFHCSDGPAVIRYKKDGTVKTEQFWFHGRRQSSMDELLSHAQNDAQGS